MLRMALILAAVHLLSPATLAQSEQSRHVVIDSELELDLLGQPKTEIKTYTEFDYHLVTSGEAGERTLDVCLDRNLVRIAVNGQEQMNVEMTAARFRALENGVETSLSYDEANSELQAMLRDGYGPPLVRYPLGPAGELGELEVVAKPGAQNHIENRTYLSAVLFHPPFRAGERWTAGQAVSMGNAGQVEGELTYTRIGQDGDGVRVSIEGQLTGAGRNPQLRMEDAVYDAKGEAIYDTARGEWCEGELVFEVSYTMFIGDQQEAAGTATGTMKCTLSERESE